MLNISSSSSGHLLYAVTQIRVSRVTFQCLVCHQDSRRFTNTVTLIINHSRDIVMEVTHVKCPQHLFNNHQSYRHRCQDAQLFPPVHRFIIRLHQLLKLESFQDQTIITIQLFVIVLDNVKLKRKIITILSFN